MWFIILCLNVSFWFMLLSISDLDAVIMSHEQECVLVSVFLFCRMGHEAWIVGPCFISSFKDGSENLRQCNDAFC